MRTEPHAYNALRPWTIGKAAVAAAVALTIFANCGKDKSLDPPDADADVLIPLAVGNSWTYRWQTDNGTPRNFYIKIIGTMVHDGKTYFKFCEPTLEEQQCDETEFVLGRNSSDGLHWCSSIYENATPDGDLEIEIVEDCLFRYPISDSAVYAYSYTEVHTDWSGDSWSWTDTIDVSVRRQQITVPAGTFDAFSYACTHHSINLVEVTSFAPGVGMIQLGGLGENDAELTSYSLH